MWCKWHPAKCICLFRTWFSPMSFPRHHHHEIFTHVMNLVARSVRFEDHDDDALDRMGLPWATNLKSVKALSPKYSNFQRSRKCSACWSFVERFAYRKTKNLSQCVRSNITSGETSCWTWKEIAYWCNATYTIHSIADSCIFAYLVEQFLMIPVVASNDFGRFLSSVTGRMLKHEAELAQPTGYQDFQFQGNEFLWKMKNMNKLQLANVFSLRKHI